MEIRRFFANPSDMSGNRVTLYCDEFYHLTKVLRYKPGYKAYVMTNDGAENLCTVNEILQDCVTLTIDERRIADVKRVSLTLYAGVLKNNKLDFTVQKAVELGVDRIVPFVSGNCAEDKFCADRARKIALEAAKQCGSVFLTQIDELKSYGEILSHFQNYDTVIFAYEFEKSHRIKDVKFSGSRIALVVGPEGGFKSEEAAAAKSNGAETVTLGRRILRAETAGIIASALTLDALGELDYDTFE